MRAAVFHAPGRPLAIEVVADPEPGPHDLVIRVAACGICGSDLHLTQAHPERPPLPGGTVLGHEFSGEIVERGRLADPSWRIGERVSALPFLPCGECARCVAGLDGCLRARSCGMGDLPGAYADYVRIGARNTIRLPDEVSDEEGAMVEPLSVALHAIHRARLAPGEDVLVIGAGPIGLGLAMWARFFGARHVIVSERVPGRAAMAMAMGATEVIDAAREEDVGAAFERITGNAPPLIFEAVGVPGLLQHCIDLAPRQGRIVVVGVCMAPDTIRPMQALVKELDLYFVFIYAKADFQFTVDMLARGRISPLPMVTDKVSFACLPGVFEALRTPNAECKVILKPDIEEA